MKHLIILGDGMADEPMACLNNKTPLQVANIPNIDFLTKNGVCGTLETIPEGYPPGSEIANMTLLGYDVKREFEGRGSLEAASMGVELGPKDVALRCNLITIENDLIKNHSAGHITTNEAGDIIDYLNEKLSDNNIRFFKGVSYRHLLVIKGGDKRIACTPPHDVPGSPFREVMVRFEEEEAQSMAVTLNNLIIKSQEILAEHPVNIKRAAEGKAPANSIWPWSPGFKPKMQTLQEKYNTVRSGSVISAVDLIKGIGVYAGLESIYVEGATGLHNTNYHGKAMAAIEELRSKDFVFLHLEASDEASHQGDVELKIKTIEYLDYKIVAPIFNEVKNWDDKVSIAVLPDHPTYCRTTTHINNPVPVVIYNPDLTPDSVSVYDEFSVLNGALGQMKGEEFMRKFLLNR